METNSANSMANAVIFYDNLIPSIAFSVVELKQSLYGIGYKVEEVYITDAAYEGLPSSAVKVIEPSLEIIIIPVGSSRMQGIESLPILSEQGYAVRKQIVEGCTILWVLGADTAGAMYGTLDIAEEINTKGGTHTIKDEVKNPYIKNRGIKFNIPLDARTPSYSDAGDSAQNNIEDMWDMDFWREFLDEMAYNKYNVLSLWNLHPFPSMIRVPEYPDIALNDVMKTTAPIEPTLRGLLMSSDDTLKHLVTLKKLNIDEKIQFWKGVMKYARDREIGIYLFTWNIYVYGTEGNTYSIDDTQTNETTIDYFRKSVRTLLETYPLLVGLGITAGENMEKLEGNFSKENWLMKTYGEGIKDVLAKQPGRDIRLIQRAHETSLSGVEEAFESYNTPFEYSFKYSQAHMYSSVRPSFGENFFRRLPEGKKAWLTVRNDDFYLYRWGDPVFAREYIKNMPPPSILAGFYMGPDGYSWGREYISTEPDTPRQQVIKKMWYSFAIWGRLAYAPDLHDSKFMDMLAQRFPEADSSALYTAWTEASKIIPLLNRAHWHDFDFQWYPEACCSNQDGSLFFHDVNDFVKCKAMPGENYIGVLVYCESLINNSEMQGITPVSAAEELKNHATKALQLISGMQDVSDKELRHTIGDMEAMAYLGQYYSDKIMGAVSFCLYTLTANETYRAVAVKYLKSASTHWKRYATKSKSLYAPQRLTRLANIVDLEALQQAVDRDVETVERA